jgi:hypothetical protein
MQINKKSPDSSNSNKENLKEFLIFFPYEVLHESSKKNKNLEHFFCIIKKEHIKNPVVTQFFNSYVATNPVNDLSKQSMEYKENIEDNFFFVHMDTLDKKDIFYDKKKSILENNSNNILSIRMINEPVDIPKHISHNIDNYVSQFKDLSLGAGLLAKDAFTDGINKSKELFKEKSPAIEQKANEIKDKLSEKFKAFKKKF